MVGLAVIATTSSGLISPNTRDRKLVFIISRESLVSRPCLFSTTLEKILEENSFYSREQISIKSSALQGEYIVIRNPDKNLLDGLWIQKLINAIKGFNNAALDQMIPKLIYKDNDNYLVNEHFKNFLNKNDIQDPESFLSRLYISSRNELQDQALKKLQIFAHANVILDYVPRTSKCKIYKRIIKTDLIKQIH